MTVAWVVVPWLGMISVLLVWILYSQVRGRRPGALLPASSPDASSSLGDTAVQEQWKKYQADIQNSLIRLRKICDKASKAR